MRPSLEESVRVREVLGDIIPVPRRAGRAAGRYAPNALPGQASEAPTAVAYIQFRDKRQNRDFVGGGGQRRHRGRVVDGLDDVLL